MSTTVSYKGNTLTTVSNNTKTLETEGKYLEADIILTDVSQSTPTLQTKSVTYTPTTSQQTDQVTADNGYDGLQEVDVTINAVASGTEGTPTATKGAVSGNAVTVTPSVTNSAGYISGGTHTGTGVSVSASELVSGTYSVTSSGTKDVTNYASASIPAGSVTAPSTITGSSASVSTGTNTLTLSKTVSVTPSVTTAGYVTNGTAGNSNVSLTASVTTQGAQTLYPSTTDQTITGSKYLTGTQTFKAVTTSNLTAENIKSGVTVTVGDSADADRILSVTGTYTGGGGSSKNFQAYIGNASRTANSYGATTVTLTVAKTGTYNVSWTAWRGSSSGTMGTNLYRNSTAGTNQQTWTGTYGQQIKLSNQSYTKDDVLTLYATSGSNSRTVYVANLIIEEV